MLDDLKKIHQRDPADALGTAEKQSEQYVHDFGFTWTPPAPIYEVIVAGMGGSGLAARAYKSVPGLQVPFEVLQDYDLPDRAGGNTLLICSSYSGNTEEVLNVLEQALDEERPYPRPMIVAVTSGGKLLDVVKQFTLPHILLPAGLPQRMTFGYQYRALAEIFNATPLTDNFLPVLEAAAGKLAGYIETLLPTVPVKNNPAKQLAQELMGKSIAIYSGPQLAPAAYKWKINFNENAKQIAWVGQYPEFNHNEMLGWTKQPEQKPYAVVELRSALDHSRIQKRFNASERLLSGLRPAPHVVEPAGQTWLEQLMTSVALGDFTSINLALLSNVDPAPVELIDRFKEIL